MQTTQLPVSDTRIQPGDWLILFFLGIVWGSSFILIKKGLIAFAPPEMALLRIEITAVALIPIFLLMRRKPVPRRKIGWIASVGLFGSALPAFLFAYAQTTVSSSVTGILNSMTPIFTWALGLLFFSVTFVRSNFIGVMIGFVGAVLIIAFEPNFTVDINPRTLLIILATVSYALSGNIVKYHLQDVHPISLSAIGFACVGIPTFIFSLTTDVYQKILSDPEALLSLAAIAVLSLMGTVLANILFFRLIQRTTAVFAASVAYLIPINAMIWGFIDGESLDWPHFVGMAFILGGVWVLRRK